MRLRSSLIPIVSLVLTLLVPSLRAQDGLDGALSRFGSSYGSTLSPFSHVLAAADLDNDQKPDGAILLSGARSGGQRNFRIELHLSSEKDKELVFASDERDLSISSLDVNRDGTPDIVVEETFTHRRLQIWLNDGRGSFRRARSEDYPSDDKTSTSWRANSTAQHFILAYVRTRLGWDVFDPKSGPEHGTDSSRRSNFWNGKLWVPVGPRAPNPSRGPPPISL